MKNLKLALLIICSFIIYPVQAQESAEALIRSLENDEREAILNRDTLRLHQLMSQGIIVHNPENDIVNFRQIMERVKGGKIDYVSFERIIERITFINKTAVVMGKEVIVPKGTSKHSGKTVTRRFTNIWSQDDKRWILIARQSTIISIN